MDLTKEVNKIIGQEEGITIEYKAVLPPSRTLAQLISAFANSEGGYIILGVVKGVEGKISINGLSEDFYANDVTHKAIDLLSPRPSVDYHYIDYKGSRLYVIKIEKSETEISIEGNVYIRIGATTKLTNPREYQFKLKGFEKISMINNQLEKYKIKSTDSKMKLLEHYQTILKIVDDLDIWNFQYDVYSPSNTQEGRLLSRILFSSFIDNFEKYLSDLLYEIFLVIPSTLKSQEKVTVEEVLNCSDLQEFVKYWANQKISKLQKGSIKGFIKETSQISNLGVIDDEIKNKIEKYLQIRHLYSHRNGIVDEKFLKHFPGKFKLNAEHKLSIDEFCDIISKIADISNLVDLAAIDKYNLSNSS